MVKNLLEISRRRKRRWATVKIVAWTFSLALIIALSALFFYTPSLRINSVKLSGLEALDEISLRADLFEILSGKYLFLIPKDNLFFYPKREIESFLGKTPRIKAFNIGRSFPSRLEIKIEERKPWAVWCSKSSGAIKACALTDKSGFLFSAAPILSGSAVLKIMDERQELEIGKNFIAPDILGKIISFSENLNLRPGEEINTIVLKPGDVFELYLKSGFFIILDAETEPSQALDNLNVVLGEIGEKRTNLEYIDLRFANKVFYRFKSDR